LADQIALVGGETLLGHEVKDVFSESSLGRLLRLVAGGEEETGKVVEINGGATVLSGLTPDEVEDAAVVILAGSEESTRKALEAAPRGRVIDLTGATEDDDGARVRAPLTEDLDLDAGLRNTERSGPIVVAQPAAVAITLLLKRLHRVFAVARSVIQVFEPASERGKAGIDELQQQTVSLLSFQPMEKNVFDAQLSFNMLAGLGDDAPLPLAQIEERIERHLATLLNSEDDGVPMPSLRLIQAPVFHGYSISAWIEFEDAPSPAEVEEALQEGGIEVRGEGLEPPNNAGIAGISGIAVGAVSADRNNGNAVWVWMVADNLRLTAENAARLAMEVL